MPITPSCTSSVPEKDRPNPNEDAKHLNLRIAPRAIDLQGHRGMRAHWPENSLLGMEEAVVAGVSTLELDVVIRSDGQPILSHEPWLSHEICLDPHGIPVEEGNLSWNLFTMSVEALEACDCGSRGHARFPSQRPVPATKPTLDALFEVCTERAVSDARFGKVRFNIELKHRLEGEGIFHPEAQTFAQAVIDVVERHGMTDRVTVQSFSASALEAVHAARPSWSTAWLVDHAATVDAWMSQLSFIPTILSPEHVFLSESMVAEAHALGLTVVPWTFNEAPRMRELLAMGVDGLITDDPYLAMSVLESTDCTVFH
ncbi:MAG: glycerophosphodiester phosphodiesterase family protein [Bacteroidetes bacterium]|nr:glycerophosphodiester phosphodiesterase family protein [Bacteroidota bacterium]MDA0904396.1 glycerophosphodiester phosphodiesterase family protein [Bacteroidota bacterium]MDA1243031.1 glycerophosphodiester phosphodiesterase family protein [Bacteroidota bacterium]